MRVGFESLYLRNVVRASLTLIVPLTVAAVAANWLAQGATLRLIVNFFITVVIVIGVQMFTGNSGVVSWGHAAFVGIGAYVTAWLTVPEVIKEDIFPGLPRWLMGMEAGFVPAIAASALVAALAALLIGFAIMRMKETAMAMSTLALLVIAHGIFANWEGWTRGTEGVYGLPVRTNLWIAAAFAVLAVVVAIAFKFSHVGLRLQSSREDSLAAEVTGVSVVRVRFAAWVSSAAVCAAAGSMWAQFNLAFGPSQFFFAQVFAILSMLVIGGLATVSGAVLGAALTTVLFEVLRGIEEEGSLFGVGVPQVAGLAQMILALVTLLILIYRPNGIMGYDEADSWLRRAPRLLGRRRGSPPSSAGETAEV